MMDKRDILRLVQRDKGSQLKTQARVGRRYYEGQHDIKDYQMFYYDADGVLVRDVYRTNVQIPHPYFKVIAQQRVEYLLGGQGTFVLSQDPVLQKELDRYFDDDLREELKDLITSVQVEGWGHLYRYLGEDGRSRFSAVQGLNVIEVNRQVSSDGNDYVIYHYTDQALSDSGEEVTITRIQVWTAHETHYFIVEGNTIELDSTQPLNPRPHILYTVDGERYQDTFGEIPFYRLDNDNGKRLSDVHLVKELIDDYDIHACSITNDIQDFSSAVYFVKGLQGDAEELNQLQLNLKTKKIAGVPLEAGIEVKTVDIPYEARKVKLDMNDRNIYLYGFGFNPNQLGDGNITNVVIRSRYAMLSLKCNRLESRLRTLMKKVIQMALEEINTALETGYTLADTEVRFERSIVTNEVDDAEIGLLNAKRDKETIDTLLRLSGLLGEGKVLELIGNALNIDVTDIDLDTLQQARLDLFAMSSDLMGDSS